MQRKHNPLVSLAALVLLVLLLVATCTGCAAPAEAAEIAETEPGNWRRFTTEHCGGGCSIITDTQTGVQYLYHASGYGGGLTVLQDGEG